MEGKYNTQNPAVKRLMREAMELRQPNELFSAAPLEENLFEWHFTIRGPADSDFDGGIFHGRIILPADYPMKPPSIVMLTPNGRFETNTKICLSISGYHPENWQPSWSIRTALLAIIGFMPSPAAGGIGSMDMAPAQRRLLAKKSQDWHCPKCNIRMRDALPPLTNASVAMRHEAEELGKQVTSTVSNNANENSESPSQQERPASDSNTDPLPPPPSANRLTMQQELRRRVMQQNGGASLAEPTGSDSSGRLERFILDSILVLVCCVLVALILRRLYMQNEWRFHHWSGQL